MHISGNVLAQRDSILALGCTPGSIGAFPPCNTTTTSDMVGGTITGNHPMTTYLDRDTIYGGISGSLICLANFPAAQIGDSGGTVNTVGGLKVGQCAKL